MSTKLAKRMNVVQGSTTASLLNRVIELREEGKDVISLNVGEPDFPTPDNIKEAGIQAIKDNHTKYTSGSGILELRKAIINKLQTENHIHYILDEITISVGAKQALTSALMAISDEDDEIIIPAPCYVSYPEMVKLAGAKPVLVPLKKDYTLNIKAIERAITPKTKGVVICTPNNPTGTVYSEKSLRDLGALALKYDFYVIADEIYEKLIYRGSKHFSIASISSEMRNHTILVNGFSKTYAMTGWRIGYVCANKEVIKAINVIQSQVTTSVTSISQYAALEALQGPQDDVYIMTKEFERRMKYCVKRLQAMPDISIPSIQGAFYIFINVEKYLGKKVKDDQELCEYLLNHQLIATVPGSAYFAPGHIRISYSNSMENLEEAMNRLEKGLSQLR